ncbi:MAG: hypothetical protein LT102_08885 [Burkholderiaceae bacterium]|nr:hypothetical protein [Burkholderiaceae bacterium]
MKSIAKFAIPTAFVFAAMGAQAQTIETDYPAVNGYAAAPTIALQMSSQTVRVADGGPELLLVQSNSEGPVEKSMPGRTNAPSPALIPPTGVTMLGAPSFNA